MTFNKWLQSRLTAHGFPVGVIDGVVGPITTSALIALQKAHGLTPLGIATAATIELLRKSSSEVAKPLQVDRDEAVISVPSITWPRQDGVLDFFGPVGQNQVIAALPFPMRLSWDLTKTITRISVHAKVEAAVMRAFKRIAETYSPEERAEIGIDIFGGGLNIRKMRGGNKFSMHSWGIALDFDPLRNRLTWNHKDARLAQPDANRFWAAWEAEGATSLGRTRDFDWMHVQFARL